jgi:hypothetical protein
MRKDSRGRREEKPVETIGIDLGDRISRYCVLDSDGSEAGTDESVPLCDLHEKNPRRAALILTSEGSGRKSRNCGHREAARLLFESGAFAWTP